MSIVRIPAVLALLAVSSCSQTSPTPTPERTGDVEGKAAAAQARRGESRRQQRASVRKASRRHAPEAEGEAEPSDEGGGCQHRTGGRPLARVRGEKPRRQGGQRERVQVSSERAHSRVRQAEGAMAFLGFKGRSARAPWTLERWRSARRRAPHRRQDRRCRCTTGAPARAPRWPPTSSRFWRCTTCSSMAAHAPEFDVDKAAEMRGLDLSFSATWSTRASPARRGRQREATRLDCR